RRRHTRFSRDWSSDVCSSDLFMVSALLVGGAALGAATTMPVADDCFMIVAAQPFDYDCNDPNSCDDAGTRTCNVHADTTSWPNATVFFCDCDNTTLVGCDTTGDKC